MKTVQNDNCLAGMQCPECRSQAPFVITALSDFEMYDDGSESHGDIEYDDDSSCRCKACNYTGAVGHFKAKKYTVTLTGRLIYSESFELTACSKEDAEKQARKKFEEMEVGSANWHESEITDVMIEEDKDGKDS